MATGAPNAGEVMPLKIGIATANLSIHGVATFTLALSHWLQAAGHEVTVITVTRGKWWSRLAELGLKGESIPRQSWDSLVSHVTRLATWLSAQNFDLLVVNVGSSNSRPLQLCLHFLPDTLPVVILLHNDHVAVYDVAGINRAAWNCAVGVSRQVQQAAAARFPQKPVHYIPNGIALPTAEQLSNRQPWTTPLRLLFVGRLEDQSKGIFRLPAILNQCRQRQFPVHLTVIGEGADEALLAQLFNATGNNDLVAWRGPQTHEAVLAAMRSHHSLLLPSNYEGLPIVLLEAQANGCVPIAARLPGSTDLAMQGGVYGILVTPDDVDGYVKGIEQLLIPEQWYAFRTAGIAGMQQHFSLHQMGEQYLTLFAALCQNSYPLPLTRTHLRRQGLSPFRWRDYLPVRIQAHSKQIVSAIGKLPRRLRGKR